MKRDAHEELRRHCAEIERCNQRGGRMLSVVDLIEAATVGPGLAAYCLAAIGRGASFLVGAMPGGAGKTTVMGALLNFVPPGVALVPADGPEAIQGGLDRGEPRRCFICHEIGSGPYYAYLWGEELRAYFDLPAAGHMLATNLHADTYEQARDQICRRNGVSEQALRRMNLMLFLSVRTKALRPRRRIESVWESDGRAPHRQAFDAARPDQPIGSALVMSQEIAAAGRMIEGLLAAKARTIEDVRQAVCQARRGRLDRGSLADRAGSSGTGRLDPGRGLSHPQSPSQRAGTG